MLHVPVATEESGGLANFPLFRSLDDEALHAVGQRCTKRSYRRDDWIVALNEINADVFFIHSGSVRLQMQKSADREVIFRDYQARDFFGAVSTIHGRPRKAGILALADVTVTRMPGEVFRELLHANADICDQLLHRMAGEIQRLVNRVSEISILDVRHRIYAELLRQSRPKSGTEYGALITPAPRQADIAARIGTRREPVAREMKALERAGLLKRGRGGLEIVDTARLQQLLEKVEPDM